MLTLEVIVLAVVKSEAKNNYHCLTNLTGNFFHLKESIKYV